MKSNLIITLLFFIFMCLSLISFAQQSNIQEDEQIMYTLSNLLDQYFSDLDSSEVNQIGIINKSPVYKFIKNSEINGKPAGIWTMEVVTDTTWYNENSIAKYEAVREGIVYRKIWIKKKFTLEGFKIWLEKKLK